MEKIESYLKIGKDEGAQVLTGGSRAKTVDGGYYIEPTIFKGTNNMRVFQEEIFGPVIGVTTFKVIYSLSSLNHTHSYHVYFNRPQMRLLKSRTTPYSG